MFELLRSVWDEPRPFTPALRVWRDWALVGVLVPLTVLEGLLRPDLRPHHVSAIAVRAQAGLATAASHPEVATDALRVIEAEASRALAEMRSMVKVFVSR